MDGRPCIARSNAERRGGFVLLMTLVLILLAGLLLAGIARHSLALASQSNDAQTDLQRRWGSISLRKALLERADAIASVEEPDDETEETRVAEPVFPLSAEVPLGKIVFHALLADENAKVNLNRLESVGGKDLVGTVLVELLPSMQAIHLRPHALDARRTGVAAFESWGQVFALDQLPLNVAQPQWLTENTQAVTCWGNGRLNAHRAEDEVLLAICRRVVGPGDAQRLLDIRRRHPELDVNGWLDMLDLDRAERLQLRNWLTDKSTSYSLWLEAKTKQRSWYELTLSASRLTGAARVSRFTW